MEKQVRIGIVTTDSIEAKSLKGMLKEVSDIQVVFQAVWGKDQSRWDWSDAEVFIVGGASADEEIFTLCEEVSASFPLASIILIADGHEQDKIRRAMQAGASEVLNRPFTLEELCDSIYSMHDIYLRKLKVTQKVKKVESESRAEVISVFSGKGGTGKTLIAANVAAALALRKKRVCLIDLHLSGSGIHLALDLDDGYNIVDVARELHRLDYELLSGYLSIHSSGIHVLCAPNKLGFEDYIAPSVLEKILKIAISEFDYIILDCGTGFTELSTAALQMSDIVVLLTVPDILSLKNTRTAIKQLEAMGHRNENILLVVNRYTKGTGITLGQIQKTLETAVACSIPAEDAIAFSSLNEGITVFEMKRRNNMTKKLKELVYKIETNTKDLSDETENLLDREETDKIYSSS